MHADGAVEEFVEVVPSLLHDHLESQRYMLRTWVGLTGILGREIQQVWPLRKPHQSLMRTPLSSAQAADNVAVLLSKKRGPRVHWPL